MANLDVSDYKKDERLRLAVRGLAYEKGRRLDTEKEVEELNKKLEGRENQNEIAKSLIEQKEEFLENQEGVPTSLKVILSMKGKRAIFITSYDRKKVFGELADIGISLKGLISVHVHGRESPVISGRSPNEIFRNCAGLKTDASMGIIAVNLNEEGEYVENWEVIEIPEVVIDFNKKITFLEHDTETVMDRIVEKSEEIDELFHKLKVEQKTVSKMTKDLNEEKKTNEVLETENKSYKSSLSNVLERTKQIQSKYDYMTREKSLLEQEKLFNERYNTKMQEALNKVTDKLAQKSGKTTYEEAKEDMQDIIEWFNDNKPESYKEISSEEKEAKPLPKPVAT